MVIKYNSRKCACNQGHTHDSKKEAQRCNELAILERAGKIQELETQRKFILIPSRKYDGMANGRQVAYIADFSYKQDGKLIVEDTKGYKTTEYIIKRKLFKDKYCSNGNVIFKES